MVKYKQSENRNKGAIAPWRLLQPNVHVLREVFLSFSLWYLCFLGPGRLRSLGEWAAYMTEREDKMSPMNSGAACPIRDLPLGPFILYPLSLEACLCRAHIAAAILQLSFDPR